MSKAYCFIDTNWLIHCVPLDESDWNLISGATEIEILICPTVSRELNNIKDDHSRLGKLRDKAKTALDLIEKTLDAGGVLSIKTNVVIRLLPGDATTEIARLNIRQDIPDNWIVAAASERMSSTSEDESVLFCSKDTGARTLANTFGVTYYRPGVADLLPEVKDPVVRENEQLKAEITRLQNSLPRLSVYAAGSLDKASAHVNQRFTPVKPETPDTPTPIDVEQAVRSLLEQYESLGRQASSPASGLQISVSTLLENFGAFLGEWEPRELAVRRLRERCEIYNQELRRFHNDWPRLASAYNEATEFNQRVILISGIKISNSGTSKAKAVRITASAPEGFRLSDSDPSLEVPELPEIPRQPSTGIRPLSALTGEATSRSGLGAFPYYEAPFLPTSLLRNIDIQGWNPAWTDDDDFEHILHGYVKEILHTKEMSFPDFYLILPPGFLKVGWAISYEVLADNTPEPTRASINYYFSSVKTGG